jgi:hypothetical protein
LLPGECVAEGAFGTLLTGGGATVEGAVYEGA